jgi:hypothetical protein
VIETQQGGPRANEDFLYLDEVSLNPLSSNGAHFSSDPGIEAVIQRLSTYGTRDDLNGPNLGALVRALNANANL